MKSSSMLSKTSFEMTGNGQNSQEAQNTVNQRDIQIDEPPGGMRIERNEGDGNDGQHVDRCNTVYRGPSENQTKHAERDSEKDQDRRNEKDSFSQRFSPDVLRTGRQWRALLRA